MNRQECLEKAIKIWEHIITHPKTGDPISIKSMTYEALQLTPDLNYCPMCEYASDTDTATIWCDRCPVWSAKSRCDRLLSPYNSWAFAVRHGKDSTIHAQAVVELIRSKI